MIEKKTPQQFNPQVPQFDPEREKRKRQQETQLEKEENEKRMYFQKRYEEFRILDETNEELRALRDAVQTGMKKVDEVENITQHIETADEKKLQEIREIAESILEKIESIRTLSDYALYLPAQFQVSRDEYQKAIFEPQHRVKTLQKIDQALAHIATFVGPGSGSLHLFSDSFLFLNKSLTLLQETHIDMKQGLQEVTKLDT